MLVKSPGQTPVAALASKSSREVRVRVEPHPGAAVSREIVVGCNKPDLPAWATQTWRVCFWGGQVRSIPR